MKRRIQSLSLILAALLQVMPMARTLLTNPSVASSFAIVMRWAIGGTAALTAFDAYSAASTPFFLPYPTNTVLTVGVYYTNSITVTNTGTDPGAYFELTNSLGLDSGQIGNNQTTTVCLPDGITLKCFDKVTNKKIYAAVYGIPTTVTASNKVSIISGFSGAGEIKSSISFTVVSGSSPPPVITNNPAGMTNVVGSNATFTVTAGTAPLAYQWYFNTDSLINYGTNTSLTVTNIQTTNTGFYSVVITNSGGAVTSAPAYLFVAMRPAITNQPLSVTNLAGGVVNFSVLAGGTSPLKYQWYFNTNSAVANGTTNNMGWSNIRLGQAGSYSVVITNSWGAVTSAPASLVVVVPDAPVISPLPDVAGNLFQFTFNPIAGLTNSVVTNDTMSGGTWGVWTNIPPPPNTNTIIIMDPISGAGRYYRVLFVP